ncbi:MAG: hypothetical protein U9R79_22395 [Armatimonadota bacterium]|nr:hypothetical protein [Armatimonadota bacterium]
MALIVIAGCQTSVDVPGSRAEEEEEGGRLPAQEQQRWNELVTKIEKLEERGYTLEQLLERQEKQEQAQAVPAIDKDLMAARSVLADAIEYSRTTRTSETEGALQRLDALLRAVTDDLPASRTIVRCERALAYLSQNALNEADAELTMAYDIVHEARAQLRPGQVEQMIQGKAREQIGAGRPLDAAKVVHAIIERCARHPSLETMQRVRQGLRGASDALERGAWPVVEAELFEIHGAVTELGESIRVQPPEATAEEEAEGEEVLEEEAEGEAALEGEAGQAEGAEAETGAEELEGAAEATPEAAMPSEAGGAR